MSGKAALSAPAPASPLRRAGDMFEDPQVFLRYMGRAAAGVAPRRHALDDAVGEGPPPFAVVRPCREIGNPVAREPLPVHRHAAVPGPDERQTVRPVQPPPVAGDGEQRRGRPGVQRHEDGDGRAEGGEQVPHPEMVPAGEDQRAPPAADQQSGPRAVRLLPEPAGHGGDLQDEAGQLVRQEVVRVVDRNADAPPQQVFEDLRQVPERVSGAVDRMPDTGPLLAGVVQRLL